MKAKIVVGLSFGDEGKGIVTDSLSSIYENCIIVRYSGGHQAGHTVMNKDVKHVFSNYGAGSLTGKPTYFSEHTCFYLNTMFNEKLKLEKDGIKPKLFIHPLANVTTPWDVAYNRITSKITQHGTVGLGIAATFKRNIETPYKLYTVDFTNPEIFVEKLRQIESYYLNKVEKEGLPLKDFQEEVADQSEYFDSLYWRYKILFEIKDYSFLKDFDNIIFEGAQGIMLDMNHGIFPNVTYSNTTSKNAIKICESLGITPEIYYVTRCYQTRHGNGWMSNHNKIELINNEEEINTLNEWQGNFRTGEIDYDLLNFALRIDAIYSKDYNKHLVVTCLDQRPEFKFEYENLDCYFKTITENYSPKTRERYELKYNFMDNGNSLGSRLCHAE